MEAVGVATRRRSLPPPPRRNTSILTLQGFLVFSFQDSSLLFQPLLKLQCPLLLHLGAEGPGQE